MICKAHLCTQDAIPASGLCGYHEEEAETSPIHYKRQNRSEAALEKERKRRREIAAKNRQERQRAKDYTHEIIKQMISEKRARHE